MKKNYLTGDGNEIELLEIVGVKAHFLFNGFNFKCDKYKFPPKRILSSMCYSPVDYAIHKAKLKHGDKYSYYKVDDDDGYVYIKCNKCLSEFRQRMSNHIQGNGCSKCEHEVGTNKLRGNIEDFKTKAILKHGDKFDYSKSVYKNIDTDIEIKCNDCSNSFFQTPYNHLIGKQPCLICRNESYSKDRTKSSEVFIEEAKLKWGDLYSYDLVDYKGSHIKVKIICNTCKSVIEQTPTNHLSNKGCYKCAKEFCVYSRSSYDEICKDGSNLYVLKFSSNNEQFFKIGISKDVNSRVSQLRKSKYLISAEYTFHSSGEHVFDLEKMLHKEYKSLKYSPLVKFAGDKECFKDLNISEIKKLVACIA